MTARINALDLFSGIGGNAYAFHSFAETKAYFEINSHPISILKSVMTKGYIDEAPVFGDVKTVTKEFLETNEVTTDIDLACGSWPCQGNSDQGKELGMDDPRSGLVREIPRISRELSPKIWFLENVRTAARYGSLKYLIEELQKLGYMVAWGVVSADNMGFRQLRERLFLVAVKPEHIEMLKRCVDISKAHTIPRQAVEPKRMVPQMEKIRLASLGNGVVPQCCKDAFERLGEHLVSTKPALQIQVRDNMMDYKWGMATNNGVFSLDAPDYPVPNFPQLVFDPVAYKSPVPPSKSATSGFKTEPVPMRWWATPKYDCLTCCNYLTQRNYRSNLGTQLRFEQGTKNEERSGNIHAIWVEWLMGYVEDYTEILPPSKKIKV